MTGFVRCPHEIYSIREVRKNIPFSFTEWIHGFQRASIFKLPFDLLQNPKRPTGQRLHISQMKLKTRDKWFIQGEAKQVFPVPSQCFSHPITLLQSQLIVSPLSLLSKLYPFFKAQPSTTFSMKPSLATLVKIISPPYKLREYFILSFYWHFFKNITSLSRPQAP